MLVAFYCVPTLDRLFSMVAKTSNNKIYLNILATMVLVSVLITPARAATFDCTKASNFVERAICSDRRLNRLDDKLGRLYKDALADTSDSSALKAEQRAWISSRNQCKDFACIVKAYADRISALSAASAASTTSPYVGQYVVDGYVLGDLVDFNGPNYRSYDCKPSDEFEDAIQCERLRQRTSPRGPVNVSATLVHARNGVALYAMVNAAPVMLDTSMVQNEIKALSHAISAAPVSVIRFPQDTDTWVGPGRSVPTSVIAIWGEAKLQEINGTTLNSIAAGENAHLGILVDFLGDPSLSAKQSFPVYRLVGGPGYIYSASFDASGKGHRHYVAVNASELAIRQFRLSLRGVLSKDQSLDNDDYRLWPEVATLTRTLALDTSPDTANQELDKIFDEGHPKKLSSHVWSVVPLGATIRLAKAQYWRHDKYGPNTKNTKVRADLLSFLASQPADPFVEFAYFLVGDFDAALKANPNSVIGNVLHYASGYKIMQSFVQEALAYANNHATRETPWVVKNDLRRLLEENIDEQELEAVNNGLQFVNQHAELYDNKPLASILTNFSARAAEARSHFEAVLSNRSSRHADDSAYMLGWLEFQQGKTAGALASFTQALKFGPNDNPEYDHDYKIAALKETVRILDHLPPGQLLTTVESDQLLDQEPSIWYAAARSAYRDFDYALTIDLCQRGLNAIDVPVDPLPVTTDPNRISEALEKIKPDLTQDLNIVEIPYLLEASKEISQYVNDLNDLRTQDAGIFAKKARAIVVKYSMLLDRPPQPDGSRVSNPIEHKDLRQALYLTDLTLRETSESSAYDTLREWLYYRKARILAVYSPKALPEWIAEMRREFPTSKLLNDVLAEQIFAQGVMLADVDGAQKTFDELLTEFPDGNSVDNAYSWMAIILRCADRVEAADKINKEIILRFPITRHAEYARNRLADPKRGVEGCGQYLRNDETW